jgi:oxalate decarboxylase
MLANEWNTMTMLTRRSALTTMVAGGVTAATVAHAQDTSVPQPMSSGRGGTDPGPRNLMRDGQNPDLLNPPRTDSGTLPNLRFSFSDARMRQELGGWTRQVSVRELGISKTIAGVNMRLNAGGTRELHWHKQAEWAYMLYGTARITAVDATGNNFVDDVGALVLSRGYPALDPGAGAGRLRIPPRLRRRRVRRG